MDKRVPPEKIRVTDAQRRASVDHLGRAYGAGCLSSDEFDERVTTAWAATTRVELADVVADLPPQLPTIDPATGPVRAERIRPALRRASNLWVILSALSVCLWGLASLSDGAGPIYPWWIWVLGGGACLLAPAWHLTDRLPDHRR